MKKVLLSDLSRTLLFRKDGEYEGSLNELYKNKKDDSDFQFSDHFSWNYDLYNQYRRLKGDRNQQIYMVTTGYIQDDRFLEEVMKLFDNVFISKEIGYKKSQKEFFESVLQKLNLNTDDVVYLEDNRSYLTAARKLNMSTIYYEKGMNIQDGLDSLS
jgi:FMN phosphatase YigB (HAD superfamily)